MSNSRPALSSRPAWLALAGLLRSAGAQAAEPRTAVAVRRSGEVRIDGRLDEPAWQEAPAAGRSRRTLAWTQWFDARPGERLQTYRLNASAGVVSSFEPRLLNVWSNANAHAVWRNQWRAGTGLSRLDGFRDPRATRGDPSMRAERAGCRTRTSRLIRAAGSGHTSA